MNKIQFFAAAFALLLQNGLPLFSQKSLVDYDLSLYKLPELKRHSLEISFDFNQNQSYHNNKSNYDTSYSSYAELFFNFNPTYIYYLNTKRLQIESFTNFQPLDFSYSRNYEENFKSKQWIFNPSFAHNGEYRFYLKNNFFIEVDVNSGIEFAQNVNKEEEVTNTEFNNYTTIPILVGFGRIERVEDARLAVYILNDLKKHNRFDREISEEEITFFAQFLSKLLNERFFDYREKKIWAIQQIDSFMIANNLLKQSDALSTALINDNWDFADGPSRKSGFSIAGGISNGYSIISNETKYDDSDNDYLSNRVNYDLYLIGKITYEKPINLYWQFFIRDEINIGPSFQNSNTEQFGTEIESKYSSINIMNGLNTGFGYYPNSRTNINLNANLSTRYIHEKNNSENALSDNDDSDLLSYSVGIQLTGNYYFSRQLSLTINTGYNHSYSKIDYEMPIENRFYEYNNGGVYFRLGFLYKIF